MTGKMSLLSIMVFSIVLWYSAQDPVKIQVPLVISDSLLAGMTLLKTRKELEIFFLILKECVCVCKYVLSKTIVIPILNINM